MEYKWKNELYHSVFSLEIQVFDTISLISISFFVKMEYNTFTPLKLYFGYKHLENMIMLKVRQVFRSIQQRSFMDVLYISTHFLSLVFFYTIWEHRKKKTNFLVFSRGYRKRPAAWNWLSTQSFLFDRHE